MRIPGHATDQGYPACRGPGGAHSLVTHSPILTQQALGIWVNVLMIYPPSRQPWLLHLCAFPSTGMKTTGHPVLGPLMFCLPPFHRRPLSFSCNSGKPGFMALEGSWKAALHLRQYPDAINTEPPAVQESLLWETCRVLECWFSN